MDTSLSNKGLALLQFLKDAATLRRKRAATFTSTDKVIWFGDVPKDRAECRSSLLSGEADESPDIWLEVRKKRIPQRPDPPKIVVDWVRPGDLDQVELEPDLLQEITILVEKTAPDPEADPEEGRTITEKISEARCLKDYPEVEDAWLEYIVNQWEPWAQEMRRWQEVQRVYEDVDFARRRLEDAEERYELLLALGLMHWRDSTGTLVKRHLLTAPAEIVLEAARGLLKVVPAASFDGFHIELDMLELQDQPRMEGTGLQERLEELDIRAWDRSKVGDILREVANRTKSSAHVDEDALVADEHTDDTFRVDYAPALVLRERRPTAYQEVLSRLSGDAEDGALMTGTEPWERFLREGEPSGGPTVAEDQSEPSGCSEDDTNRVLFPLPTNDEQRQIVDRLHRKPYVLVKGPPGTGKSHTIANLICHLLARGERVLVTAHTAKALTVLRGLLPDDMRDLCVTALGSSREDQRLLGEGIRGILRRQNEWAGSARTQEKICNLERELRALEDERAGIDTRLREHREAETRPHQLASGYEGTAARIARQLELERESFGWFPEVDEDAPFPLKSEDLADLVEMYVGLTQDRLRELQSDLGDFDIPDPDGFKAILVELEAAEKAEQQLVTTASPEKIGLLRDIPSDALEKARACLKALDEHAARASHVLGQLAAEVLSDLIAGIVERWTALASNVTAILERIDAAREKLATVRVETPSDVSQEQIHADALRRLEHFENGGRRGLWVLTPRAVSQTQYVENRCRVNGRMPRDVESLRVLLAFLQLRSETQIFASTWPAALRPAESDPRQVAAEVAPLASEIKRLLDWFNGLEPDCLTCIPANERVALATQATRDTWSKAIEAEIAGRRVRTASEPLSACLSVIQRCLDAGRAHPCLDRLARAAEKRDAVQWRSAWESRRLLQEEKDHFRRYERLVSTLNQACPALERILEDSKGDPEQKARLLQLNKAWAWSTARTWIERVSDPTRHRDLVQAAHRCHARIEKKTQELAALRSWLAFFGRLDELTAQYLNAWTRADNLIGKDTGTYAYRRRRTARKFLMPCIPKIPGWIMPLHKLWETVEARPGLFDTIIIDEASQAGIESLILLLLAKRIIVVGDDRQNSPEAVGVLENDIARLVRQHLTQFRFQDLFRPDTSLFDHAERAFGNPISLREHFRCVPEIIRFSNELCYRDAPLIPLRQAPPNRLAPLRHKHVPQGSCEGTGQRIHNRPEAEVVVEVIRSCLEDEAYEGKTMGVIALQGHAQAELIGSMLAKELDPKVIEERRLRCGEPATFQGDQRDLVFLSLVIALNVRYRALTELPWQRRFNVAMSRAKDQVWLFHSVQQSDLSPECLRRRLLAFFQSPMQQALGELSEDLDGLEREVRQRPRQHGTQPEPYESWFEVDVALELLRRHYRIRPQYEFAGCRIDIVVEDPILSNRLAVECDGDTWHGPEQYEKDMARQRQLERGAKLTFVRIGESEFYADRSACVQQILDACESLGIRTLDQVQADAHDSSPTQSSDKDVADDAQAFFTQPPVGEPQEEADSASEFGPFTGYSPACAFPDPREASSANIRGALRQIIEKDGPLTRNSVFRLYVEGCPDLQRVGKTVRQTLSYFLGAMLRAGEIVQEEELGSGHPEGQVVRLAGTPRVRERPAGQRDLLEIPPSELAVLLNRLRTAPLGACQDVEALFRSVLDHYGFTRLTASRRRYLQVVLSRM